MIRVDVVDGQTLILGVDGVAYFRSRNHRTQEELNQ